MSGSQRCDSRDQLSETAEFDIDDDISQKSGVGSEPNFVLKGTFTKESKGVEGMRVFILWINPDRLKVSPP